jgi:hypothetical protein
MKTQPQTIAKAGWKQSGTELVILYALTSVVAVMYLQLHWLWAMLAAPVLMLVVLGGVAAVVQSLWMLVVGIERVGEACGMRKTPLT